MSETWWESKVAEHEHMQRPESDDVEKTKKGLQNTHLMYRDSKSFRVQISHRCLFCGFQATAHHF